MVDVAELTKSKRKEGRIMRPMSLRKASDASGISAATLCRIENGEVPDVFTLTKLCKWLGISIEDAVEWVNVKKSS